MHSGENCARRSPLPDWNLLHPPRDANSNESERGRNRHVRIDLFVDQCPETAGLAHQRVAEGLTFMRDQLLVHDQGQRQ